MAPAFPDIILNSGYKESDLGCERISAVQKKILIYGCRHFVQIQNGDTYKKTQPVNLVSAVSQKCSV